MAKKIAFILIMISSVLSGQIFKLGEARGLFMSIAVGPKIPIGAFSDNRNLGVGFDAALSYTDNKYMPMFAYARIGYQHYPGKQGLYKRSDYSSFSSNVILIEPGIRFFLPPLFNEDFILLPIIEGGFSWGYFENYHQFKVDTNRDNFVEEVSKFGIHLGGGFSMFLMDVITYYNYFQDYQFISVNLRIRIPIFVKV